MEVKVEKPEKNLAQVEITIDAEKAMEEYSKACRILSSNISIPGFRVGKAPRHIVEKHVGVERLKHETLNRMLPPLISDVINSHNLDVITEPYIESFEFELGQNAKVVAKMELKPDVTLKDYKGLNIDVEIASPEEGIVDKELKNIQERFVRFEEVKDRESTNKDVVMIDFEGFVDNEPLAGGTAKNYQLDLANSNFIPGFAEALVGHKTGEEFEINVTFPENYHEEKIKGKPATFKIKLNAIKEKTFPEINDELALKVGPFANLEELKKDIQDYTNKQYENDKKIKAQTALLEKIIAEADVEISNSMIEREAQAMMAELKNQITSQGMSWDTFMQTEEAKQAIAGLKTEAEKRIKNSLVLAQIAKNENLQADDKEFEKRIKEMANLYKTDENTIYQQLAKEPMMLQSIMQQIMSQQITDFLVENNTINYINK